MEAKNYRVDVVSTPQGKVLTLRIWAGGRLFTEMLEVFGAIPTKEDLLKWLEDSFRKNGVVAPSRAARK
jgi:hypothetical protein